MSKKAYKITVTQTITDSFTVIANSEEEAREIVEESNFSENVEKEEKINIVDLPFDEKAINFFVENDLVNEIDLWQVKEGNEGFNLGDGKCLVRNDREAFINNCKNLEDEVIERLITTRCASTKENPEELKNIIKKERDNMEKIYLVEITETLQRVIQVRADSKEQAEDFVIQKYHEEEFILTADNSNIDEEIYALEDGELEIDENEEIYDAREED